MFDSRGVGLRASAQPTRAFVEEFRAESEKYGWYNLQLPSCIEPDGGRNLVALDQVYNNIISPILNASEKIVLYSSGLADIWGAESDILWVDLFSKVRNSFVLRESSRFSGLVPKEFWCGEINIPFQGGVKKIVRGVVLAVVSEDFKFGEVIRHAIAAQVTVNLGGAVGKSCLKNAIGLASERDSRQTVVLIGMGRASVSSVAVIPGKNILSERVNEVVECFPWDLYYRWQ